MKSKLFLILGICLFAFTSCSEITMEEKSENVKITNYGSVNVYSDRTDNRAIEIDSIKFANVKITGKDIETGFEPFTNGVTVTDGKGSFTVNDVPVGKNRIVTVIGLDSSKSAIYGVQLRNIVDVEAKTNDVVVNWASTALGNVFAVLHDNDVDVSTVDKEKIQNAISSSVHASLIDVNAIATDYKNNSLKAASSYIMQSAGLDLTCDDNGAFKIQVCDPASKVYSGSGTSGSVTGISPGTWKVMLLDSSDNVIQEEVVVFASGKTSELSFATVKDKIVLHAYDYVNVYIWETSDSSINKKHFDMEQEGSTKWYKKEFNVTSASIIFTKSSGGWSGQTSDLSREAGEYWYKDGKWYDYNPDDTEKPIIAWNAPAENSVLTGEVTLSVIASDNVGISKIEFYSDDKLIGTAEGGKTSITWDSANTASGNHSFKAIAYDAVGNFAETALIQIKTQNANKAPVANAGGDKTGVEGVNITFDGSKSTDNGEIVSYAWDFGDGSTGVGKSATHSYTKAGTYTVKLVVTDEEGLTGSATISVKINEKGSFIHRDFREENVYFMMTDRFADGDKSNNNLWGDEYLPNGESQMYDFNESKTGILSYYHGGDFKGIIDNLDYLVDMGFTAIWITPSVKQAEGRFYYGDYEASAFHGYWGYDFDQIDPHLHSSGISSDGWADYKAMVDACHAKGIRVMQDVVINHGNQSVSDPKTKWHALDGTVIMDGQTWTWETKDKYYDGVNLSNGFYAYKDAWGCAGLIDFNDKSPDRKDARQHMINVYKKFIDAGVDAFRIDTVAYVTNEWCGEFADAMYNHAKSLGNDHFYMIGEAWCGRYDAIARHSKDTTDSLHMLDMHLSCLDYPGEMSSVFKDGGDYSRYNNVVASDANWGTDAEEHTWTSMFVDNHDCFRNNGIYSETQYKNALNYIYLFRGVPIVFYGTEAMYSWSGAHASTNKDDVVSRWMLGDKGISHVKQNKPTMYKHLKALNTIRSASPCIQKGVQENIELKGDKAVFTRTHEGKTAYVAISKGAAYSQKFDNVQSGTYIEYSSSSNGTYTAKEISVSGSYTASVPANGFTFIEPK